MSFSNLRYLPSLENAYRCLDSTAVEVLHLGSWWVRPHPQVYT